MIRNESKTIRKIRITNAKSRSDPPQSDRETLQGRTPKLLRVTSGAIISCPRGVHVFSGIFPSTTTPVKKELHTSVCATPVTRHTRFRRVKRSR